MLATLILQGELKITNVFYLLTPTDISCASDDYDNISSDGRALRRFKLTVPCSSTAQAEILPL